MDKTPRKIAIEAWRECGNDFERKMEHVSASVIAHARPWIERAARAAAFESAAQECDGSTKAGMYIAADIRALADLPASHVCVPVDLLDALSSEEGAEQKDISAARSIVEASRNK